MQIWKHTRRAPTISLSIKWAWILRKAMSLIDKARNRNSPNTCDHMLIWKENTYVKKFTGIFQNAYSFVRPPEHWFEALFGWQHCTVSSADEWIELKIGWCLKEYKYIYENRSHIEESTLRLHNQEADGTFGSFLPVVSLLLPSLSLVLSQFGYHIFWRNYYWHRCCSNCYFCLKLSETGQAKVFFKFHTIQGHADWCNFSKTSTARRQGRLSQTEFPP